MIPVLKRIRNKFLKLTSHSYRSFSQEGEDMLLRRLFQGTGSGFFVDVGAFDPVAYSNTYYFYKQGWSGINIDARPGSMVAFNRKRPRDINIEAVVGRTGEKLEYFQFNHGGLNTLNPDTAKSRDDIRNNEFYIVGKTEVTTRSLAEILEKNLPPNKSIDFLTVDVEDHDLVVLESNDWQRFRPKVVVVEQLNNGTLENTFDSPIFRLMQANGYEAISKLKNSVFYRDSSK